MASKKNIFSGVRVLDLTKVYSGPLATRYLADYGADVLKIESPSQPDPSRSFPPIRDGVSGYYEILNRNKAGMMLDLKVEADRHMFYKLVKTADVVVENMTPSAKVKLKVDYKTVRQFNKKIIYASLSGKGQDTDEKYFDIIAQAESGLMSLTGTPSVPTKIGPAVVDAFAGVNLAFAISSALYHREVTGKGQNISVSMLGSSMNLLEQNLVEYSVTGKNPVRQGNLDTAIAPFGIYKTKDRFVALAIGSDILWQNFVRVMQDDRLAEKKYATNMSRLKANQDVKKDIERVFQRYTSRQLVALLKTHNLPVAEIAHMSDVAANTWLYDSGALEKIVHPDLGLIAVPGLPIEFSDAVPLRHALAPQMAVTDGSYTFDKLGEGHLARLTDLLDECFRIRNPDKKAIIRWKYFGRGERFCIAYGAFYGKKLVSFYSNVSMPTRMGQKTYDSYASFDMATSASHRKRGLISVLSKKVYQEIDFSKAVFSFGFSNGKGVKVDRNASSYGYHVLGSFDRYVALARRRDPKTLYRVQEVAKLTDSRTVSQLLTIDCTEKFVEWRYQEKPGAKYTFLELRDGDTMTAQVILIKKNLRMNIYKIIPMSSFDLMKALQTVQDFVARKKKYFLSVYPLQNSIWSQSLYSAGFRRLHTRQTYYLTVRPSIDKPQPEGLLDADSWFLMGGDIL